MNDSAVTLGNTLFPMMLIAALAAVLPWLLTPGTTRSHARVILAVFVSALAMCLLSACIFALFDKRDLPGGQGLAGLLLLGWLYVQSALSAVFVWAPVLGLVWLGLAQRVERLRGDDMAREEL